MSEVKSINMTRLKAEINTDDYVDVAKNNIEILSPSALYLNKNFRFVSGVTYDCSNTVWNRVVSVPFMFPNGDIRYY